MTLIAKKTTYNGYKFNSILEARWAYWADLVSLPYVYEPDVYDIDGEGYIPDFYLTPLTAWMEIKGQIASNEAGHKMIRKCMGLAKLSKKPVILAFRDPLDARCAVFGVKGGLYTNAHFTACPTCGAAGVMVRTAEQNKFLCPDRHPYASRMAPADARRFLFEAATAARQARFGVEKRESANAPS